MNNLLDLCDSIEAEVGGKVNESDKQQKQRH